MKNKATGFVKPLLSIIAASLLGVSALVQADETGIGVVTDAAIAVNVITSLDSDTRAITLKDESGEKWTFTAGSEVRNFDQLKRGDLVMMEYYSGLAVALEPKGSGLEQRISEVDIERAAAGAKPGAKITESTYVEAKIVAIDTEDRVVALEGPQNVLVLEVGESLDLAQIEVGQEIEALYVQSYAVSVLPAPKVSGSVTMKITDVSLGIGLEWGKGKFDMYDGTNHEFKVGGLTVLDVGIAGVEATGEVYNLVEAKDLEGLYFAGEAGGAFVAGGGVVTMKNTAGVVIKLKSTQKGVRLTLAGEGLKITLK